jgi:ketosteroid isomerase-like protein
VSSDVEIVGAGFDAWNRGDLEVWLAMGDPRIVFRTGGIFPDFEPVYRGHDGMRSFWHQLREPWDSLRAQIERVDEHHDALVVWLRFFAEAADAPPVTLPVITAFQLRDGLITRMCTAATPDEALEGVRGDVA